MKLYDTSNKSGQLPMGHRSFILVFGASELPDHVPQGEDRSKDKLRVIFSAESLWLRLTVRDTIRDWYFGRRVWSRRPFLLVYAFSCASYQSIPPKISRYHTMAIKDVEGIYYHDGDLVTVILELMYLYCESPDLQG